MLKRSRLRAFARDNIILPPNPTPTPILPRFEALQEAMEDRAGDILTILSRKEKYQELVAKINDILDRIKQNLPPEFEKSMLNLDDYTNDMKVFIGEVMYKYGAMDGINYHRIIRKIRREGCNIDPPAL